MGNPEISESDAADVLTASRALLGVVARSLAPALEQVTLPQFRVLVILSSSGPMRSRDLADALGVHPSTFTRTADRLVAGDWVRRMENPHSRREILIELRPKGRRLVQLVTTRRRAAIDAVLEGASDRDRARIISGMRAFATAAGEPSVSDLAALGM